MCKGFSCILTKDEEQSVTGEVLLWCYHLTDIFDIISSILIASTVFAKGLHLGQSKCKVAKL